VRRRAALWNARTRLAAADRAVFDALSARLDPEAPGLRRQLLSRADNLDAGQPVIVHHPYELDQPTWAAGPWVLEPDGTLAEVEPIYADPTEEVRHVLGYRRADGSTV